MVVSEPSFFATSSNKYKSKGMLFSDNRGSVFYVNFTDPVNDLPYETWDDWEIRTVATLHSASDAPTDSYSVPSGLMGGSRAATPGRVWIAGGTANVARADPPSEDEQLLVNKSQMIFAFVMPHIDSGQLSRRSDWTPVNSDNGHDKVADGNDGWYIPLQGSVSGEFKDEYVTTRPVLFGGNLYVATFRESIVDVAEQGACDTKNLSGTSRLYAISLESGDSMLWGDGDDKYLEFHGMKIVSFTVSETGNTPVLYAAYQVLNQNHANNDINTHTSNEDALSKVDGMDVLAIKMVEGGGGRAKVTSNDGVVNYWRFLQQ